MQGNKGQYSRKTHKGLFNDANNRNCSMVQGNYNKGQKT